MRFSQLSRTARAMAGALLAISVSQHGQAQPSEPVSVAVESAPVVEKPTGIKSRFGVPQAKRLLASDDLDTRIRGVARLGAIGTEEAVAGLVEALELGTGASRQPSVRLSAVRQLARYVDGNDAVRDVLARELTDIGGARRGAPDGLSELIRGTAALALARAGDPQAIVALTAAIKQGDPGKSAAMEAFRAYPPSSLGPIIDETSRAPADKKKESTKDASENDGPAASPSPDVRTQRALSLPIIELLGDLGDLRAIPRLRRTLKRKDQRVQVAAAVALAKLGDASGIELARAWLKRTDPKLRDAAIEVFRWAAPEELGKLSSALISTESTRTQGLLLARSHPSATHQGTALGETVRRLLPTLDEDDAQIAFEVLAAIGDAPSVEVLVKAIAEPQRGRHAAYALAMANGEVARDALEASLASVSKTSTDGSGPTDGRTDRRIVRASILRALRLGDAPSGLHNLLTKWAVGRSLVNQEIAAFGLVALANRSAESFNKADVAVRNAAARGLLALASPDIKGALATLTTTTDASQRTAASVALLFAPQARGISTTLLTQWIEQEYAISPLAARALGARDDEVHRTLIERYLTGTDPLVRAYTALGLAVDPEPDAVSLLTQSYRDEADPLVRRAVVRALSARDEPQRHDTLHLARDLDPDREVRLIAASALSGKRLDQLPIGGDEARRQVAWVSIVANSEAAAGLAAQRGFRAVRADGSVVPAVTATDGEALLPSVAAGDGTLSLEPARSTVSDVEAQDETGK